MRYLLLMSLCTSLPMVGLGADGDEWIVQFNGKDLSGWTIDGPKTFTDKADNNKMKPLWTVENGLIRTEGKGFGFLRYDREFTDFVWHVEYRLSPTKGVNSGLGIRTGVFDPKKSTASRPSFFSYEIQLLDDSKAAPTKHTTCSLYRYVAPAKAAHKPAGEWNTMEITCRGPKIIINMNGTEVLNFDQSSDEKLKNKPLKGHVCLQSHSNMAEFRNLKIKELK